MHLLMKYLTPKYQRKNRNKTKTKYKILKIYLSHKKSLFMQQIFSKIV